MQIKKIKWAEDLENKLLVGRVENYELFEIETFDDIITLTDVLTFDITYPTTVEEAKKNAQEILNKFINKMIFCTTSNGMKLGKELISNEKVNIKLKSNDVFEITEVVEKKKKIKTNLNKKEGSDSSTKKVNTDRFYHGGFSTQNTKDWKTCIDKVLPKSNKKVNTDNWKKQKRDSKGRFIPKKVK